jgi:phage protein D
MTAPSPSFDTPRSFYAPRAQVRVSGLSLAAELHDHIISVSYDSNVDMADMFTVVLRNPGQRLTDSPLFDLGKTVEVHMGYGETLEPMMLGEITSLQPSFPASGPPTLTVSGYDRSQRLRHNQPDRPAFQYMNDSLIASQIAVEAGLIPVVDPSRFQREKIHQTTSDMAFLKDLARQNFFETYVWWDKLYFRYPRPQTEAVVLEWGRSLSSFAPRMSSAAMAGLQVIRGYNEQLAQSVVGFAVAGDLSLDAIVEKLGGAALDLLASLGRRVVRDQSVKSPFDAALLAKAALQDILDGFYEGSGSCVGMPALRADRTVVVRGVGKRFSGRYRLKKVTHTVDGSGYHTTFEVTQRSGASLLSLLRKQVKHTPAPDRREPFFGVVSAEVTRNVDEEGLGRVKVKFPWYSDENESAWARCVAPMSGDGIGAYFLPDVGDEVLVAFVQGNFDDPMVLGGLWNGKRRPPAGNADGLNRLRLIKTKAGHTITLDDTKEKAKVQIQSSSGLTVTLDDTKSAPGITLEGGGRRMVMSNGKVEFS